MDNNLDRLIEGLRADSRLQLTVKIYEPENTNPPLGTDLTALEAVWFAGGVAEVVYSYASYLAGSQEALPYEGEVLRSIDALLSANMGLPKLSWIDLYETFGEPCRVVFREQLLRRRGGYWGGASGDILRLELVELWKENPSCRKIIASGITGAMLCLAVAFGGTQMMQEHGAEQCRQEVTEYASQQTANLIRVGQFEGKFPQESYSKLQDALAGGIAACGSHMSNFRVTMDPGAGFTFGVGGPPTGDPK